MRSLLVMVLLVGCATEAQDPGPGPITIDRDEMPSMTTEGAGPSDVCTLAAQLPAEDICSHACDPDAMIAQLEAEGSQRGACYQFLCSFAESQHALVGVCLPP